MVPREVERLGARTKQACDEIAGATPGTAQSGLAEFASVAASRFDRLGLNQHTADAVSALDPNGPTARRHLIEGGIRPHRVAPSCGRAFEELRLQGRRLPRPGIRAGTSARVWSRIGRSAVTAIALADHVHALRVVRR